MRIAVSQMKTRPGDFARTFARVVAQSRLAAEQGAELVVFPYPTLLGSGVVAPGAREALYQDLSHALRAAAGEVACPCLLAVPYDEDGVPAIEPVLLTAGEARLLARVAVRQPGFAEPLDLPVAEIAGARITFARSYEELDALLAQGEGAAGEVACFLPPYGYAVDDISSAMGAALSEGRYVDDVRSSGRWLVAASGVGGYGSHVFCGASFVLAPDGRLCACAAPFEEELLMADVGPGVVLPAGSELSLGVFDEPSFLWEALVVGLHDYATDAGYGELALALDGSLASLVLAALATDAMGPTHVHALDCVRRGQARRTAPTLLARTLRIDVRELEGAFASAAADDEALWHDLAQVSLARLAREAGALTLSRADKTALALEGQPQLVEGGAVAPLGDVYRIDVLDLAHLRNTVSPVFGQITLSTADVAAGLAGAVPIATEALIERIDDAIALRVEGGCTRAEVAEGVGYGGLAEAVVDRLDALRAQGSALPATLSLSTCRLAEYLLPHGLAWRDKGEPLEQEGPWETAAEPAEDVPFGTGTGAGEAPRLGAREIAEALGLLHDLSLGEPGDWRNPFSEN